MEKHKIVSILWRSAVIFLVFALAAFLIYARFTRPIAKILLYHSVTSKDVNDEPDIGIKLFERQLKYMQRHGLETVFLSEAISKYKADKHIPDDWVVLTFDGGHEGFYQNVYPLLKKRKVKATIFVVTSMVGDGLVTWDQLREMKASGLVEIGSHSQKHLAPTCITKEEAWKEKIVSKEILEDKLGGKVDVYAYPFGAVNDQAKELVKKAGYKGAVGLVYRAGEYKLGDVYNMRRIYVSEMSRFPLMFRFMLSGYYVQARRLVLTILNIKVPRDVGDCWQ